MADERHDDPEAALAATNREFAQRIEQLGTEVEAVRADWERKRADPGVPGAPPREDAGTDAGTV